MTNCPLCNYILDKFTNSTSCTNCDFVHNYNVCTTFSLIVNNIQYSIYLGNTFTYLYFGKFFNYNGHLEFNLNFKQPNSKQEAENLVKKLLLLNNLS